MMQRTKIEGLFIWTDYISEREEKLLLDLVDSQEWSTSSVLSDSEWKEFTDSLPPLTLSAEEVEELKRRQLNDE